MSSFPRNRDYLGFWLNEHNLLGEGVEVGVAYGNNAEVILSQWQGKLLHGVDPYVTYEGWIDSTADLDMNLLRNCCLKQLNTPRFKLHQLTSEQAAPLFPDQSLDFVYIDANHAYAFVLADMKRWAPKVRPGGLLCGHDFWEGDDPIHSQLIGVAPAVRQFGLPYHVTPACSSWWIQM
jgi:Methyltransferase domain